MSEARHTPGPWKVISEETAREVEVFEIAEISHYRVICDGRGDGFAAAGEPMADARLIAASPNLLETVKAAALAFRSFQFGNASEEFAEQMAERCLAAIARATGEQQ